MGVRSGTTALAITLLLALPAAASASTRYAVPTGGAIAGACAQVTPCTLTWATQGASSGDTVIVEPGTYTTSPALFTSATVTADPTQPRPIIDATVIIGSATVTHLQLDGGVNATNSTLGDDVINAEVSVNGPMTIEDSLVFATGGLPALYVPTIGGGATLQLTRDTIVAGGSGFAIEVTPLFDTVTANDSIVVNESGTSAILIACPAGATNSYTSTNDDELTATRLSSGGVCPLIQTGTVAAPPVFVATVPHDAYELHEAAGSPTIDAGASASPPATDIDGQPRVQGAAIDIGAGEYETGTGPNLIRDGDAESGGLGGGVAPPAPWITAGPLEQIAYGTAGFPAAAESQRIHGGAGFLSGGPSTASSSTAQHVDLTGYAAAIDAGTERATLAGFLGGFSSQLDDATVTVSFQSAGGTAVGTPLQIGPVTALDRSDLTEFRYRTAYGAVPQGARTAIVTLSTTRDPSAGAGQYDDGYADNLSLTLAPPVPAPPPPPPSIPPAPAVQVSASSTTVHTCKVPSLTNLTSRNASKALSKAGCKLGMITTPHSLRHVHNLVVRAQSQRAGKTVALNTKVNVTLGRKPVVRRRR
jgi:hypothetical protein